MKPTEPTGPLEDEADPSNEEIIRDRLKTADKEENSSWPEVKRRVLSQPVAR
jgi:hypothetical protein